jgi:glycosyltransferase involved in cell wall biosynthesis
MAERIRARGAPGVIHVLPPWPHEDELEPVEHRDNPFRARHGLEGRFVFMLSGNLSVANPVTTVLEAALRLRDDARLLFLFVGGGHGRREIEEAIRRDPSARIALLPYQPLAELRYSLSAADVHLVSLGDDAVGIVHPCKIYGAMAVSRPVLYLGPEPSHVADIVGRFGIGWRIAHGDIDGAVRVIREAAATPPEELGAMGRRARSAVRQELGKDRLCGALCDVLERRTA